MYPAHIITVLLLVGSVASTDANTTVGPDDNVRSDAAHGPHAPSDLSDEVNMMQGGMRVSRTSNLEVVVQKAVQEAMSAQRDQIAAVEKAFFQRAEELKQKNDELFKRNAELSRSNEQMREKLDKQDMKHDQLFKRNEELSRSNEQIHEKLNQQEMKHEQLRKDHRLSYGMLLQICDKGLRGLAGTSKKRANVTDVARGNKQKFAPDVVDTVVDGTVDAANTVAEGTVDAANAVADVATDAFDTIADLPGDVADWTLEQLENLKSLIGLSWDDIPGLKDVINGVKDFAVDTVNAAVDPIMSIIDAIEDAIDEIENAVNTALDTVKDWVSILEEELKKVTDYVADLYNKYLKPIITMIWDCAKNAKTPIDFVVCVIKPVLEKLLQSLIPTESVDMVIPFPFDDEALQIDPESGVYTMQQPCTDCQEGDMRDLAPLRCATKEFDFLSIFKVTAHACNVPYMPGQCGGNLVTCLKKRASQCAKSAMLWSSSGVLSKLSAPVEQAMALSQNVVQKITDWTSRARALYEEAKQIQSSSEDAVEEVLSKFMSAVDNAKDSKDSVIQVLKDVAQLSSAGSVSKMVKAIENIIASVEELISAIERSQASIEDLQTGFSSLSSSTEASIQSFYSEVTSGVQALKSDIDTVNDELMQLYQDSMGVADDLLDDFQAALAAPVDQLENLGDFMQKCALARESYQKVYVDLEVATMTAGRLALHERDGVKLAYVNPKFRGAELYNESWPWSSLATKEGQELELCAFVYCAKFQIRLRKNPKNIFGLPIQGNLGLDVLKFFELEYKELSYDLNVIGVPYKFTDPTGIRFPSITIPFLVDTLVPAQNPTHDPSVDLDVLWQLVTQNQAEAQQIADGTATAPSLPATAQSGNDINQVKSEVDHGIDMSGTAFTSDELVWSTGLWLMSEFLPTDEGQSLGNWGAISLQEARSRCEDTPNCVAFAFVPGQTCFAKMAIAGPYVWRTDVNNFVGWQWHYLSQVPFDGDYDVYYLGDKRAINMEIGCDGSVKQPGIFEDRLHFGNVKTKCTHSRDSAATMYIEKVYGTEKFDCLYQEGSTLKGNHYLNADLLYGEAEYRKRNSFDCKGFYAGVYEVYYLGGKRVGFTMEIACDGSVKQPGVYEDRLHFTNVKAKCPDDPQATMYIEKTYGDTKFECLWLDGSTIKGTHYLSPGVLYGSAEFPRISYIDCQA
mmetsp:Transcript_130646/g.230910  ORF Transcript_130646/g.230910 Transcript_130646/m.230910 type:complete len:1191 (+) Transcript_130646:64-3636(+)